LKVICHTAERDDGWEREQEPLLVFLSVTLTNPWSDFVLKSMELSPRWSILHLFWSVKNDNHIGKNIPINPLLIPHSTFIYDEFNSIMI
jgi:hypothetical protein